VNLIVAAIPFLIFVTNMAPGTKTWDTGILVIESHGFASVRVFVYTIIQRIILLLILFVSFILTERYLSYGFIVGMALQVYRIAGVFNPNVIKLDEWEWLFVAPIAAITVWVLFIIHRMLHRRLQIFEFLTEIDNEIENIKRKKK